MIMENFDSINKQHIKKEIGNFINLLEYFIDYNEGGKYILKYNSENPKKIK